MLEINHHYLLDHIMLRKKIKIYWTGKLQDCVI